MVRFVIRNRAASYSNASVDLFGKVDTSWFENGILPRSCEQGELLIKRCKRYMFTQIVDIRKVTSAAHGPASMSSTNY